MRQLKNIGRMLEDHVLSRLAGRPSPSQFWYTPTRVALATRLDLDAYLRSTHVPYPIDYSTRTAYPLVDSNGAVLLSYGGDIGDRINPEASFQAALGWHTQWLRTGESFAHDRFMAIAERFVEVQTQNGDFEYDFDWFESKAPWTSALSQSRGASVLMRAARSSGESRFSEAAQRAIGRFCIATDQGGYMTTFEDGAIFFEEYPSRRLFTFNGFLASLIGLFEISRFENSQIAEDLFKRGIETLERHGTRFFTSWWTLYDLDRAGGLANVHSPMYHRMICEYLQVLEMFSENPAVSALLQRARRADHLPARSAAVALKLVRKVQVR